MSVITGSVETCDRVEGRCGRGGHGHWWKYDTYGEEGTATSRRLLCLLPLLQGPRRCWRQLHRTSPTSPPTETDEREILRVDGSRRHGHETENTMKFPHLFLTTSLSEYTPKHTKRPRAACPGITLRYADAAPSRHTTFRTDGQVDAKSARRCADVTNQD